jgi:hypothetical protein
MSEKLKVLYSYSRYLDYTPEIFCFPLYRINACGAISDQTQKLDPGSIKLFGEEYGDLKVDRTPNLSINSQGHR